jgi:hypothetical protein
VATKVADASANLEVSSALMALAALRLRVEDPSSITVYWPCSAQVEISPFIGGYVPGRPRRLERRR